MAVVSSADDATADWLTDQLTRAGFVGTVRDVSWRSIGAGQVGENVRFSLQVEGDFPATLVGKFPSTDPTSRQTGIELMNYAREVFFYTTIAQTVDIRTPKVYATEFDPETHDFVILMEDLAPGVQIDQMSECSTDQAALAIDELAKLHGPRWGDERLAAYPLLQRQSQSGVETPLLLLLLPGFLERYGPRLSSSERSAVEALCRAQSTQEGYAGAMTLVHVDYRLDNMIFDGPHPLTVLDWQSINLGCALQDTSYFLGTSLEPAHRVRDERMLLSRYLDGLGGYGVELCEDVCWDLYRRHAPAGLNMAVIASMIVGETERGNDMFMTMAKRSLAMCEDLQTLDLLSA
jgi:hypothetical protein